MRVQISSGRGPAECELAVGLYLEYLCGQIPDLVIERGQGGWLYKLAGREVTAYKSVSVSSESTAFRLGAVKWVCHSPLRKKHPRKNWFIEVSELGQSLCEEISPEGLNSHSPDKRLIKVQTFRSSGRGGQNVNKVETGVRVIHIPTGIACSSTTARTQSRNRKLAMERLISIIMNHNHDREQQMVKAGWQLHDQLVRGNPTAIFEGTDFIPQQ